MTVLHGWSNEGAELRRTLSLDDAQHAALTERLKIVADALQVRPEVRRRNGATQIRVARPHGSPITASEVTLAARVEALYRSIMGAGDPN